MLHAVQIYSRSMLHTVHSILEHVQYSAYYSMCDATLRCILHIIGLIARVNDN